MGCGNSKSDGSENHRESPLDKSGLGDNTVIDPQQNGDLLIQSPNVEVENEEKEKEGSGEELDTLQPEGGTGDRILGISVSFNLSQ